MRKIAQTKIKDLNAYNLEQAIKIIEGTARSMGIEVVSNETVSEVPDTKNE